jgi:hypothetical protein
MIRRALLLMAAGLALSGCAAPGPHNPGHLPIGQVTQVQQLCRDLTGYSGASVLYGNCVDSLQNSALQLNRGRAMQRAREECLGSGLAPGGIALSECELATAARKPSTSVPLTSAAGPPSNKPRRPYYRASWREIRDLEQHACAQLGYDPIDSGFDACVGSLDVALWSTGH